MPVVAELRNVIIGDDTSWRAAVVRTQESLAALQAQSQQATAGIATAFSGLGASTTGASVGFQTLANEAQVAGASVASSASQAAASIMPLNGAAAEAASGMTALGASAVQAGAGVSELALRKAQLVAELSNVNAAIRTETSALGAAQSAVQNLGTGHLALNNAVKESEANLAGYILRQAALKGELAAVNTALNGTTSAHRIAAPALLATGAATGELGSKTNILTALMTAQTTQISSQRTIWEGYDNVIQAVIRTMGGIPVAAALAITIFGILAEKLLHLGDEKKEQIRLDRELIETDIQLWQAMNTGTLFTQQYATVLHDINAVNAQVKTTTEALLTARAEEADAIRKSSTAVSDYAATTSDLQTKVAAYVVSLFSQVKGETEATAARIAASKAMAEAVELEIRAAAASGKTIEQLIAERQASGATAAELGLLASAWGTATAARATYESGRTALSTLKLELAQAAASRGEVLKGATAITTLKNAIAALPPEQRKLVEQSQLTEKSLRELNKTTEAHGASARGAVPHVKALTQALSEQEKVVKGVKDAMNDITEKINSVFRNVQIGQILHEKIIPVINEMMQKLAQLSGFTDAWAAKTEAAGVRVGAAFGEVAGKVIALNPLFRTMGEEVLFGDGSLEKLIGTLRDSKAANEEAARAAFADKVAFGELMHQFEVLKDKIPESWGAVVDAIVNGSGKAGAAALEFGVKVAGALGDVAQVIGNLPGKIGDSLRKATSEFEKWFNTIDGILKLLNRVFSSVPAGLGDALSKIIGIFKKSSQTIQDTMTHTEDEVMNSTEGIAKSAETSIGGKVPKAFGIGAAAAAGFATAMSVAANSSSKAIGFLEATVTSALAGIAAGFAFGPVAGAIVGGVSLLGGIIGLFRGKSATQKASEQAQLDKLKADIAATVQSTVNAAIDGMKSALELFDKLADFTVIPQKTIHRFFNHLELVLQEFVELSKVFSGGMLDAAKAFAEKIGPVLEVIGNAVGAFEALGGFTGVAQISVDSFASAMTRVLQSFIGVQQKFVDAEGFIDSTVNQARKFAQKIGGVIEVIKNALDAFAGFTTFKNVLPETLDAFAATLQLAINKMGAIAEAVDKAMIKTAQRFSDRAVSVVGLIKTALDAFGPLATFAAIPAEAMDALFAGISDAVSRMQDLAATLDTEMLTRAVAVAEKSAAIFNAIKGGVDALTSLADFKAVAPEAFQALLDGFNQAVAILNQMLGAATQFESLAIQIEDKLVSAAQHLKDGAAAMAAGLAAATSATGSSGGSVGVASLSAGAATTGFGIGAPAAPFGSSSSSSSVVSQPISVSLSIGTLVGDPRQVQDMVVDAITAAQRRGRLALAS